MSSPHQEPPADPMSDVKNGEPSSSQPTSDIPHSTSNIPKRRRRKLRIFAAITLSLLVLLAISMGGAEYYTARPDFCGSCHIMDPYHVSWTHDKHSGKANVWCVECHYAPGEHHTLMAKFRGLSQLTSYFSGRAGASRPRAHVNDASCMRPECHGDNAHMDKKILIGQPRQEIRIVGGVETTVDRTPTVWFDHAKHLRVDDRLAETETAITAVLQRLGAGLPAEDLAEIRRIASSVLPAGQRQAAMESALAGSRSRLPGGTFPLSEKGVPGGSSAFPNTPPNPPLAGGEKEVPPGGRDLSVVAADAAELMQLEHRRLRLQQLESITCAACHGYDASGQRHFAVDQQSCFVCHFTNQAFNQDTGSCLTCHEPPVRKIVVHDSPTLAVSGADGNATPLGTAAMMDHQDIVKRGINCESCHADVIRGQASVSARECTHCHDQARFLEGFEERSTQTVAEYHRVHVAGQRARCPDCHKSIEHSLVDAAHVGSGSAFLQPVLDDCQHCHPSHHREQVQLLAGVGGKGVERPMPNAMFGSRLNCRACHTQPGSDFKGAALVAASANTCVVCHGEDYRKLFEQWTGEIEHYDHEVQASLARIDAQIEAAQQAARPVPEQIRSKLDQARSNYQLVHSANGIHNKAYALQLLDMCQRDLDAATRELDPGN